MNQSIGRKVSWMGIGLAGVISPCAALSATYESISNAFDITVEYEGTLSESQQSIFASAEYFWESMLLGNRYDLALPSLVITASGTEIDGEGGTLGQAAAQTVTYTYGFEQDYVYASSGYMEFDTADLSALESAGTLFDVIVHEMGHVIGFGSLWDTDSWSVYAGYEMFAGTQSVYTSGTGQYTGAYGVAAYAAETGTEANYVPVELDGGAGTANAHWDETAFALGQEDGVSTDIMTGYLNADSTQSDSPFGVSTLSATTIASFADIGYITVATDTVAIASVPLPAGGGLLLLGLGGVGALTLRRRAA
ncbi:hypothetical protein Q4543_18840 [Salipiger sp. 1_MG-2023]|uniref:hypothetical protein n=1 Tax=Salipiger sp. 1_MG-2023 TaxID=3062665 RepID=UPI0026E25A75|nr:hypothetical protein [Salipiger sp. 1_MG-2023]MDO6587573.1 hypothetical protein [Salipiger sp. 1_MG-2023]